MSPWIGLVDLTFTQIRENTLQEAYAYTAFVTLYSIYAGTGGEVWLLTGQTSSEIR